jgi:hypothetical protein
MLPRGVSASVLIPMCTSFFMLLSLFVPSLGAQQAGGVAAAGQQVHVVRSIVGAKGEQRNGSFVMTEPRMVFCVPEDREVIVYFEWEGSKGVHHCEGNGERIDFNGGYDFVSSGGALLNDQGEVIGILGGALPASCEEKSPPNACGNCLSAISQRAFIASTWRLPTAWHGASSSRSLIDAHVIGGSLRQQTRASKNSVIPAQESDKCHGPLKHREVPAL